MLQGGATGIKIDRYIFLPFASYIILTPNREQLHVNVIFIVYKESIVVFRNVFTHLPDCTVS
jgi:hypothetical protein